MATEHADTRTPSQLAAIMFVDQVASTRQCAELGDEAAFALHCQLQRVLIGHITARTGWLANSTGDGVLALFASPVASIAAACAIQSDLYASNAGEDRATRTEVRIGIHVGEPLFDPTGNPFGLCVNLTARICALAGAGETLVSDLVNEFLDRPDRRQLVASRCVTLRGAPHPTRLWRLSVARPNAPSPAHQRQPQLTPKRHRCVAATPPGSIAHP